MPQFDCYIKIKVLSICNLIPLVRCTKNLKGSSYEYSYIITVRLMIKYWWTLIPVSTISLSAKLSSLCSNKRRVKLVILQRQKLGFFLCWMQLRTNNWFQTNTYFIHLGGMKVPVCRMTCLSPQILLHRKSLPILMTVSEIVFFPQFEPKAGKD